MFELRFISIPGERAYTHAEFDDEKAAVAAAKRLVEMYPKIEAVYVEDVSRKLVYQAKAPSGRKPPEPATPKPVTKVKASKPKAEAKPAAKTPTKPAKKTTTKKK